MIGGIKKKKEKDTTTAASCFVLSPELVGAQYLYCVAQHLRFSQNVTGGI